MICVWMSPIETPHEVIVFSRRLSWALKPCDLMNLVTSSANRGISVANDFLPPFREGSFSACGPGSTGSSEIGSLISNNEFNSG